MVTEKVHKSKHTGYKLSERNASLFLDGLDRRLAAFFADYPVAVSKHREGWALIYAGLRQHATRILRELHLNGGAEMRRELPSRRKHEPVDLTWEYQKFTIGLGYYDEECRELGEVFCVTGKTPQAIQHLAADACVFISIALQHGVPREVFAKSLPRHDDGYPYTIAGLIADRVAGYEWAPGEDGTLRRREVAP